MTFPVLVALGFPPVTATTSNAIGLITGRSPAPSAIAGVGWHGCRLAKYGVASFLGAVVGAALLLSLPPDAFETIVPVLVGTSVLLVAVQPLLARRLRDRPRPDRSGSPVLYLLVFLVGVYGGYFTAAQGIMLVGVMGLLLTDPLQRLNAFKNTLASVVNIVAGPSTPSSRRSTGGSSGSSRSARSSAGCSARRSGADCRPLCCGA